MPSMSALALPIVYTLLLFGSSKMNELSLASATETKGLWVDSFSCIPWNYTDKIKTTTIPAAEAAMPWNKETLVFPFARSRPLFIINSKRRLRQQLSAFFWKGRTVFLWLAVHWSDRPSAPSFSINECVATSLDRGIAPEENQAIREGSVGGKEEKKNPEKRNKKN